MSRPGPDDARAEILTRPREYNKQKKQTANLFQKLLCAGTRGQQPAPRAGSSSYPWLHRHPPAPSRSPPPPRAQRLYSPHLHVLKGCHQPPPPLQIVSHHVLHLTAPHLTQSYCPLLLQRLLRRCCVCAYVLRDVATQRQRLRVAPCVPPPQSPAPLYSEQHWLPGAFASADACVTLASVGSGPPADGCPWRAVCWEVMTEVGSAGVRGSGTAWARTVCI